MEYKDAKTLNELKQIFEKFEKRSEETIKKKVYKVVLNQTSVFFASLVIVIGVFAYYMSSLVVPMEQRIRGDLKSIDAKIENIRTEVMNNKVHMTKLESKINTIDALKRNNK